MGNSSSELASLRSDLENQFSKERTAWEKERKKLRLEAQKAEIQLQQAQKKLQEDINKLKAENAKRNDPPHGEELFQQFVERIKRESILTSSENSNKELDAGAISICVAGPTSTGKSTLLNALMEKKVCATGADETTQAISRVGKIIGPNSHIVLYDLPGTNDSVEFYTANNLLHAKAMHLIIICFTTDIKSIHKIITVCETIRMPFIVVRNKVDQMYDDDDDPMEELAKLRARDLAKLAEYKSKPRLYFISAKNKFRKSGNSYDWDSFVMRVTETQLPDGESIHNHTTEPLTQQLTKLHISNLPLTFDGAQLHSLFQPYGEIESYGMRPSASGDKGSRAFVILHHLESAQNAVRALNNSRQGGQQISVRSSYGRVVVEGFGALSQEALGKLLSNSGNVKKTAAFKDKNSKISVYFETEAMARLACTNWNNHSFASVINAVFRRFGEKTSKSSVKISNIPSTLGTSDVHRLCAQFGTIAEIHHMRRKSSVNQMLVTFSSVKEAKAAIEGLRGFVHDGLELQMQPSVGLDLRNIPLDCTDKDILQMLHISSDSVESVIRMSKEGWVLIWFNDVDVAMRVYKDCKRKSAADVKTGTGRRMTVTVKI